MPSISLKGKNPTIVKYQSKYVEKGYKASYLGKDITKSVKVRGNVNSKKLGEYKIKYLLNECFDFIEVIFSDNISHAIKSSMVARVVVKDSLSMVYVMVSFSNFESRKFSLSTSSVLYMISASFCVLNFSSILLFTFIDIIFVLLVNKIYLYQ